MKNSFISIESIRNHYLLKSELSLDKPSHVQYIEFPIFAQNEGFPASVTIGRHIADRYEVNALLAVNVDHILEGMGRYIESGDHDGIESIDLLMVEDVYRLIIESEDDSRCLEEGSLSEVLAHINLEPVPYGAVFVPEFLPSSFITKLSDIDIEFWVADAECSDFDADITIFPKTDERSCLTFDLVVSFNRDQKKVSVSFGCNEGDGFECFASIRASEKCSSRDLIIKEIQELNSKGELKPRFFDMTVEHLEAFEKVLSILDSFDALLKHSLDKPEFTA